MGDTTARGKQASPLWVWHRGVRECGCVCVKVCECACGDVYVSVDEWVRMNQCI